MKKLARTIIQLRLSLTTLQLNAKDKLIDDILNQCKIDKYSVIRPAQDLVVLPILANPT